MSFAKTFSLPLLIGVTFGALFPAQAISLVTFANSILFFLMLLNGLLIDGSTFFKFLAAHKRRLLIYITASTLILPVILFNFADLVLKDPAYKFGFLVSSLAPTAFVAPYFIGLQKGTKEWGVAAIVLSTLIYPFILFGAIHALPNEASYLPTFELLTLLVTINILPLGLSFSLTHYLPKLRFIMAPHVAKGNSILLATLMFTLCGSTLHKIRWSLVSTSDVLWVVLLMFILDFGVFYFLIWLAKIYKWDQAGVAIAISTSMRNVAIPAGLLLQFHPKASIVPCVGLLVHILFFQFLSLVQR